MSFFGKVANVFKPRELSPEERAFREQLKEAKTKAYQQEAIKQAQVRARMQAKLTFNPPMQRAMAPNSFLMPTQVRHVVKRKLAKRKHRTQRVYMQQQQQPKNNLDFLMRL